MGQYNQFSIFAQASCQVPIVLRQIVSCLCLICWQTGHCEITDLMRSIVKEVPVSWAHLYVAFSPRWPHFWYAQKVKPFKSLESGSTSTAWVRVCSSVIALYPGSVEFGTLWAYTWNNETLVVWTVSQMSDHNSFPHSPLDWIFHYPLPIRGIKWPINWP